MSDFFSFLSEDGISTTLLIVNPLRSALALSSSVKFWATKDSTAEMGCISYKVPSFLSCGICE